MQRILKCFFALTMMIAVAAAPALAAFEGIDAILGELDGVGPATPLVLDVNTCIDLAIENNHELLVKQAILNSVEGDAMIDRSRFFSHVDFLADFTRSQGNLLKTYAPALNPISVAPLGSLDTSNFSSSMSSSGGSGVSGFDTSSLEGIDLSQAASIASSMGIDISQYLNRPASDYSPAERRVLKRMAEQTIPGTGLDVAELQALIEQMNALSELATSTSTPADRTKGNTHVEIRYSRRLLEWGKDSSSSASIRANRRLAIYNYEQKLRDVIAEVRTTFFTLLLKQRQIDTRQLLLVDYEKRHWQQQKRFEIAKDVPRVDVLTAELDVLNEKNRISSLKYEFIEKKYELLQVIDRPLDTNIDFVGSIPSFSYSVEDVVRMTKENSFQISYLKRELNETEREYKEIAWDYKPIYSAQLGLESRRTALGLTLNNVNQTYGVDLGVSQHLNLASDSSFSLSSSSNRQDHNYSLSAGVIWNLYDNTKRKGVDKKFLEKLNEERVDLARQIEVEELNARKSYNSLAKANERLELQEDILEISRRRLEINRKLREYNKIAQYQLDNYRDSFFAQQDKVFSEQENLISAQENLRRIIGIFD